MRDILWRHGYWRNCLPRGHLSSSCKNCDKKCPSISQLLSGGFSAWCVSVLPGAVKPIHFQSENHAWRDEKRRRGKKETFLSFKFSVAQKCQSTHFKALTLWKVLSGKKEKQGHEEFRTRCTKCPCHAWRPTHGLTDGQTYTQTHRQTDGQAGRQAAILWAQLKNSFSLSLPAYTLAKFNGPNTTQSCMYNEPSVCLYVRHLSVPVTYVCKIVRLPFKISPLNGKPFLWYSRIMKKKISQP